MGTTQSMSSRLEEGGGAPNRIDTLPARVTTALGRHLVVSFPEQVPATLTDAVCQRPGGPTIAKRHDGVGVDVCPDV